MVFRSVRMGDLLEISQPSYSDKLQVFYCPPTEAAVQSVEWVDVRMIGQVLSRSAIERGSAEYKAED